MSESRGYQVCLYMGREAPTIEGTAVIPLYVEDPSIESLSEVISLSGLTPSDLRARTLFMVDSVDTIGVLGLYAFLIGFCGRRLDVAVKDEIIDAVALHETATRLADSGKPAEPIEVVQVGRASEDLPYVLSDRELTESDVTLVRWSRKALLVHAQDIRTSLVEFLAISGIRCKNNTDRLPTLVSPEEGREIDLDSLRRAGGDLRRSIRTDDRNYVVEPVPLSERQSAWLAAAQCDIEEVLSRLGSVCNEETGLWRCPRPERHTNGDANPSLRATDNMVRCFRCDAEPVDALRLVMDSREVTADEAAAWLLGIPSAERTSEASIFAAQVDA